MLQARLWGRPTIAWVLDAAVAVLGVALLLLGNGPVQLLGGFLLVLRVVTVTVAVLVWRRTTEGRAQR